MSNFVNTKKDADSPPYLTYDHASRLTEDEGMVGGHDYGDDHPYVGLLEDANKGGF